MNRYLIDTNVISETSKPRPDISVMAWLKSKPLHCLYMSVMTYGELLGGIERCKDLHKQSSLRRWMHDTVLPWFENRIIPVDMKVASRWGIVLAEYRNNDEVDTIIAATAIMHNLTLVTRNERHFGISGLKVVNPWKAQ